jgi:hypothetical protein
VERALHQVLDQLGVLTDDLGAWAAQLGPVPWVLMGMAIAGVTHELGRRRNRGRPGLGGTGDGDAVSSTWFFGLPGVSRFS